MSYPLSNDAQIVISIKSCYLLGYQCLVLNSTSSVCGIVKRISVYRRFLWNVQVAKLSRLSGRISELEKDLATAMTNLAASEEGLKQANIRAEKADALAEVSGKRRVVPRYDKEHPHNSIMKPNFVNTKNYTCIRNGFR